MTQPGQCDRPSTVVREAVEGLFAPAQEGGLEVTRLEARRRLDFTGAALWHHSVRQGLSLVHFSAQSEHFFGIRCVFSVGFSVKSGSGCAEE